MAELAVTEPPSPPAGAPQPLPPLPSSTSPSRRAWQRFKRNRLGFWSLVIFCTLVALSLLAEVLSNDKPLVVRYEGQFYFPLVKTYAEKTFGGDFETETDYLDPFIRDRFSKDGNWAVYPPNPYGSKTINYFARQPNPSAPSRDNWLGTDDRGRDLLAQLIYGFRVSVLFALALTTVGVILGVAAGAVQGFFGGKTDLAFQRFIEIWGAMPELYLLIIFSAILSPSDGVPGGTPRPRKSSEVSAKIAALMRNGRKVTTGVRLLGRMWRQMICRFGTPKARAALT